ncbi:MAG: response regulator transcription factor [Eggerthellaceae bacterium]|nr:response regulator transcription factor [Eggerthellaceae bacterium]
MFKVLIVEDDQKLNSLYCSFLEKQGYEAVAAHNAAEAIEAFETNHFDIALCDIMMPGVDGVMLVDAIRKNETELPIMMLTALGDFKSKQRAFGAGSDDYMVKPVDLNELALRMSALLRRSRSVSRRKIVVGDAVLDSDKLTVVEGSNSTVLPPKEFLVLFKLCSSPGRIFTRRDIMDDVWGIQTESGERTVDVHIKRLRKRFESSESFKIETVRGIGYKVTLTK